MKNRGFIACALLLMSGGMVARQQKMVGGDPRTWGPIKLKEETPVKPIATEQKQVSLGSVQTQNEALELLRKDYKEFPIDLWLDVPVIMAVQQALKSAFETRLEDIRDSISKAKRRFPELSAYTMFHEAKSYLDKKYQARKKLIMDFFNALTSE